MPKGNKSPARSPKSKSPKSPSPHLRRENNQRTSSASGVLRHEHGHVTETDFFDFQPHTIFGGISLLSVLFLVWKWYSSDSDPANNIKLGICAALWSLIVFAMMHFPDGIMIRPHPIFWRFFMALLLIYMMIVVFGLFQDYKTLRQIIGYYDPKSLLEDDDRSWTEDCRISTPEKPYLFFETVFDEFMLAHLLGYWGKMLVLRDWYMVTFVSVGFELVEWTMQYMMPNFRECWWDHLLADLVICNAGGAFLGWLTLKAVGAKEYEFVALGDIPSIPGKAKRVVSQLVPRSLDRFNWAMFDSFKRFTQVFLILFVMLFGEFNSFVTKQLWNLPPTDLFVNLRLQAFGWVAVSGVREYYEFVSGDQPYATRIGPAAWLIIVTFLLESLWCFKMIKESKHRYFDAIMPAHIGVPWTVALSLFAFWIVAYFSTKKFRSRKTTGAWLWRGIISFVLYLVLIIIGVMCYMATPFEGDWLRDMFDRKMANMGIWIMPSTHDASGAMIATSKTVLNAAGGGSSSP